MPARCRHRHHRYLFVVVVVLRKSLVVVTGVIILAIVVVGVIAGVVFAIVAVVVVVGIVVVMVCRARSSELHCLSRCSRWVTQLACRVWVGSVPPGRCRCCGGGGCSGWRRMRLGVA